MKYLTNHISLKFIICLFSVFLIAAGFSRYIETDSGNILIHDIDLENNEGIIYKGRLFRPLQASSLNNRPAVLIVPGFAADRYSGDHIAMEFARRGFVVLTIEDFSQGMTDPKPKMKTENSIDTGYTFLSTRTFVDHERIGLLTFYEGAEKTPGSNYLSNFAASIFISPPAKIVSTGNSIPDRIFSALYEEDPDFRFDTGSDIVQLFTAFHSDMLVSASVISESMEHFHEHMAIPNDSPFWFDASSQKAPFLLFLRNLLLLLLMIICNSQCILISNQNRSNALTVVLSIFLPLVFFTVIVESMNCFLISVRLGSPINYLSRLQQVTRNFSPIVCLTVMMFTYLSSISISKNRKIYLSDLLFLIGIVIYLFGIIQIIFINRSGWNISVTIQYRWLILLLTIFSALNSFLIRFTGNNKYSKRCCSILNGLLFYWVISNIPLSFFLEGSI